MIFLRPHVQFEVAPKQVFQSWKRSEASGWEYTTFKLRHAAKANERRPVAHGCQMLSQFRTLLKICVLHLFTKNCRGNQIFFGRKTKDWRLVFFRHWGFNKWKIPVHNWLRSMAGATIERFGMLTTLPLEVQGPGSPYRSRVLPMFGDVWGLCRHNFSRTCISSIFPSFQFWKNASLETWWCFDFFLTAISTHNSYHSDRWIGFP